MPRLRTVQLPGLPFRERVKDMLNDSYGRTIDYLRISVTDRCNLRCSYCMPDGITCVPMGELLTYEEIAFVCAQAAALGVRRFRITGGEPLVRKGCAALVAMIRQIPGAERIAMTTNGLLLAEHLDDLLAAGLDAVNISLNATDPEQYRRITGTDGAERVLETIRMAAARLPVRVNCVVQREINGEAPESLALLAREMPVDVRFIEMMPVGAGKGLETVPNAEILCRMEARFGPLREDPGAGGGGPAVYYRPDGFAGRIGFISAVHGKFCDRCNRLRLTSTGELKPCLCYADTIPLREILRDGDGQKEERVREKIREAVRAKPEAHCFERTAEVTERRKMAQIGG